MDDKPSHPDQAQKLLHYLLKRINRAIREFRQIEDGDRVAVALSGGKDSRTLLEALCCRRRYTPERYEVIALHVVGTSAGFPDLRPELEPWLERLGVPYEFVPLELPPGEPRPLSCFRCSWNRRKALFLAADRLGCNKLAFGHHADDAAATVLMNLAYQGRLEPLWPRLRFFEGRITLIRPLIYVEEREIRRYARAVGYPEASWVCLQGTVSKRHRMKALLQELTRENRHVRANLWRAARRAAGF